MACSFAVSDWGSSYVTLDVNGCVSIAIPNDYAERPGVVQWKLAALIQMYSETLNSINPKP